MIKTNRMNEISEIVQASKEIVENLFNEHQFCDICWCRPKQQMQRKKKEEGSQSSYRCKIKDKKLHEQVWKVYAPFTTLKRLQELAHCFDTKGNERMNTSIETYTPKTKTHGITTSLANRLMMRAGSANLGAKLYQTEVYSRLYIDMGKETTIFLRSQYQACNYKKIYRSLT